MEQPPDAALPTRTRRRGDALDRNLLDAAITEILAVGAPNVTIEGVARREGAGKTSLYRRWPDKHALLRSVAQTALLEPWAVARSAAIRASDSDVVQHAQPSDDRTHDSRALDTIAALLPVDDPAIQALITQWLGAASHTITTDVLRSVDENVVDPELVTSLLAEVIPALVLRKLLYDPRPLDTQRFATSLRQTIGRITALLTAPHSRAGHRL